MVLVIALVKSSDNKLSLLLLKIKAFAAILKKAKYWGICSVLLLKTLEKCVLPTHECYIYGIYFRKFHVKFIP